MIFFFSFFRAKGLLMEKIIAPLTLGSQQVFSARDLSTKIEKEIRIIVIGDLDDEAKIRAIGRCLLQKIEVKRTDTSQSSTVQQLSTMGKPTKEQIMDLLFEDVVQKLKKYTTLLDQIEDIIHNEEMPLKIKLDKIEDLLI